MNFDQHTGDGRGAAAPAWSEQFCMSRWCRADRWFVRPDERNEGIWQVAESPYTSPWSVAASRPVCPLCGEGLADHVEGVGDIEAAPPAAIISFLHTLEQAA